MSEHSLNVSVSEDLKDRLDQIAEKNGLSVADALQAAVADYVETWEDYHRTVTAIETGEDERRSLAVAND